jgi:predicted ATPase
MHVVRAIRLLEPFEDPRALAETCIHERQRDRRNIAFARSVFQRLQDFARFNRTPQRRKEMALWLGASCVCRPRSALPD